MSEIAKRGRLLTPILAFLAAPEPAVYSAAIARQIKSTVGRLPAEQGGVLGGHSDGAVCRYRFDSSAHRTGATYSPDTAMVNQLMKAEWNPRGTRLKGFAHSHPVGFTRPSSGDRAYAARILDAITDLDSLLLPIVQSVGDGVRYSLASYRATLSRRGAEIERVATVVLPRYSRFVPAPMFERVTGAYDLKAMAGTRLVVVGVGGAAAFVEEMARAGIGEFVLIDPDRVELSNLATQQVYRTDLGRAKVEALARRIRDINPDCRIWTVDRSSDALDDRQFERVISRYLPGSLWAGPPLTILCGFTDSFPAQARVSRLALKFGVPMLAAQVYFEGRGAEVTFSAPGVTPACGRCVTGGRYRAYLEEGFHNDVGSAGTPLLATTRLNATKAMVALALIHGLSPTADRGHRATRRWSGVLDQIAEKNLVQMRMDPAIGETLGLRVFDRTLKSSDSDRIVMDETLWLRQEPESPSTGFDRCPDCGGYGDLRLVEDSIGDTSVIPRAWVEGTT